MERHDQEERQWRSDHCRAGGRGTGGRQQRRAGSTSVFVGDGQCVGGMVRRRADPIRAGSERTVPVERLTVTRLGLPS